MSEAIIFEWTAANESAANQQSTNICLLSEAMLKRLKQSHTTWQTVSTVPQPVLPSALIC